MDYNLEQFDINQPMEINDHNQHLMVDFLPTNALVVFKKERCGIVNIFLIPKSVYNDMNASSLLKYIPYDRFETEFYKKYEICEK